MTSSVDIESMRRALLMARTAMAFGEIPVGAVVVSGDRVIAQAYNLRESLHDPTAHAECMALSLAGRRLGRWRLDDCQLVVTLEPCPMCAGAILQARIPRIVYGAADSKAGACHSLYRLTSDPRLNHQVTVVGGVLAQECSGLLSQFFTALRSSSSSHPEGCLSG